MSEEKVATFTIPALPSILNGIADVFQRLDAEISLCIAGLQKDVTRAHEDGIQKGKVAVLKELVDDFGEVMLASGIVEQDHQIILPLMKPAAWETVEEPTGGHGDNIEYTGGRQPSSFEFEEPWVELVYNELNSATIDKIMTYFCEAGE